MRFHGRDAHATSIDSLLNFAQLFLLLPTEPMDPIGTELKAAREKQNISLRQVADQTRISFRHLESLEEGRYDQLPGGVYNRAFLRSYSEFLGLDPRSLLALYDAEISLVSDKSGKPKLLQSTEIKRGIPSITVWGVMLLLTVTGLFLGRRTISSVFSSYFSGPSSPQPSAARIETSRTPESPKPPPNTQDLAASAPPVSAVELPKPAPTENPAAATPEPVPSGGKIRIQFHVTEKCWASVDRDGNRVLVRQLEPGETPSFDADRRFYIVLGNAGGVRMTINSKPAKSLGDRGKVVRLLINEQNLQDLMAQK